ncbi:MAG: DUF459 domain-containing protein [Parvibaculum sp.]|nr:DUF459 domain-containing protein [Parvibaculum sp.]
MQARAAKAQETQTWRLARLTALVLPLVLFWWASAAAQPLQLAPPRVESAALIASEPPAPVAEKPAESRRYNVVVMGDSLGDGTWAGLYHVLRQDKRFTVIKKSRVATGFSRADYYDWNAAVRDIAAETRIDIAVVVMGTNDRQPIVENGRRHALFDAGWREIYERRVDEFTATLQATGARIYWLELPVMRSPRFGGDMAQFNEIFENRAHMNGVAFVRTAGLATDENGDYTAYGADRFGRTRLLRAEDGIHFTMPGYELLGQRMANAIVADIESGGMAVRFAEAVPQLRAGITAPSEPEVPAAVQSAAQEPFVYDTSGRRPGRSDDWRWTGPVN